jgi:tetratricopeptide (TPR) repeat protein
LLAQELIDDYSKANQETDAQRTTIQQTIAGYYLILADLSLKRGQHAVAIDRYDAALEKYRKLQSTNSIGQTLLRKADLYFNWGRRKEKSGQNADAVKRFQHSFEHYREALKAFQKTRNQPGIDEANNGIEEANHHRDKIQFLLDQGTTSP